MKVYYNDDITRKNTFQTLKDYDPVNPDVAKDIQRGPNPLVPRLNGLGCFEFPLVGGASEIRMFRQLKHPNQRRRDKGRLVIPVAVVTSSINGTVNVWVEDILSGVSFSEDEAVEWDHLKFTCIHHLSIGTKVPTSLDISFINLESDACPWDLEENEVDEMSMILNVPQRDFVQWFRQTNSTLTD
jgi:hypothetical protein